MRAEHDFPVCPVRLRASSAFPRKPVAGPLLERRPGDEGGVGFAVAGLRGSARREPGLSLLSLLSSLRRLFPRNPLKTHCATESLTFVSLPEVCPPCVTFLHTGRGFGVSAGWMGRCLRRPLRNVVYCIVCRTSVSCSPQGLVAWESTWLPRTRWSSSTLTGTPRTTCKPRPEPIGLGRRSRSVGGAGCGVRERDVL